MVLIVIKENGRSRLTWPSLKIYYGKHASLFLSFSLSFEERIKYEGKGDTWRESSRHKLIRLISIIISLELCTPARL